MAAVTAVTITITTPAGTVIPLNVTATDNAARRGTTPSAVEQITIRWGQPSPRDGQTEGDLSLTLWTAQPTAIPYESLIEIRAQIDGRPAVLIGRGWCAAVKWLPQQVTIDGQTSTVYLTRLTCATVITRAAAMKAAADDVLWAGETEAARLARYDAAAGVAILDRASLGAGRISHGSARKVSASSSLLSVFAAAVAGFRRVAAEAVGGLGAADLPGGIVNWSNGSSATYVTSIPSNYAGTPAPVVAPPALPAAAIEDAWRGPDRTSLINRIVVASPEGGAGEVMERVFVPATPPTRSISEAHMDVESFMLGGVDRWVAALLADGATPAVTLDPTPVRPDRLPPATFEALIAIASRAARHVQITDCPPDLDPWQVVTAGTLTIGAGLTTTLELTLHPATLAGCRPVRFSDSPTTNTFARCGSTVAGITPNLWLTAARLRQILAPKPY